MATAALAAVPRGDRVAGLRVPRGASRRGGASRPAAAPLRARSADDAPDDRDARRKRRYVNVTGFPFPLTPLLSRRTTVRELLPDRLWSFEQEQGIGLGLGVSTNVRMTVLRLDDGTLFVHDPIAPTEECLDLLRALNGAVSHVVLATTQYEHKIFLGPFARRFPSARVWVAPGQFSFPINLPSAFLGFPRRSKPVPADDDDDANANADGWPPEMARRTLRLPRLFWNQYEYCESAFYHRSTKTLLLTDAAVHVSPDPPEIIPRASLVDLGAEDGFTISLLRFGNYRGGRSLPGAGKDRVSDPDGCAAVGWRRMALFSLFIAPDAATILRPEASFAALEGRFAVSPIVYEVVFQFHREAVREWVESVRAMARGAERVLAAHFPAYEGEDAVDAFAEAFRWAESESDAPAEYANAEDLASLELVVRLLRFLKALPPEK